MDYQLPEDFMNVEEAKPVPRSQYEVRIVNAEVGTSEKSGLDRIAVQCEIPDHPNAAPIYTYLQLPGQEGLKNPDWTNLQMKRFLTAFNIPFDGSFNIETFPGATAFVTLDIEHDDTYGDKNVMQLPKLG
ncbi:MAG: hypothetical protein ACTSXE_02720 [Candidatus Thorarchaeota archaeon]